MKSTLEDLYYGEISPFEDQPRIKCPHPHKDIDEKLLDEFLDSYNEAQKDLPFYNFKQGFILGSRLMLEIMQDD